MAGEASGTVTMEELNHAADEAKSEILSSKDDNNTPDANVSPGDGDSDASEASKRLAAEHELQAVKSNLGRKLAAMEENQKQLMDKLENLSSSSNQPANVEDDDFEIPTTREEFNAAFEAAKLRDANKMQSAQSKYEKGYLDAVNGMSGDNAAFHEEVYKEMLDNFNIKHSDNAGIDAQLNYAKAEAAILRRVGKATPLDKNKNIEYENSGSNQEMVTKKKSVSHKLNAEEQELASMFKMTDEQIQNALDAEVPIYQRH